MLVFANRDEFYDRQGKPPELFSGQKLRFLAPIDPRKGGTWFGINERGLLVAITNRLGADSKSDAKSRGHLVREILTQMSSLDQIKSALDDLQIESYNPFSLIVASTAGIINIKHTKSSTTLNHWQSGQFFLSNRANIHVFDTNTNTNLPWDSNDQNTSESYERTLISACKSHDSMFERNSMCKHGLWAGTLSSSIVVLDLQDDNLNYTFCQGRPCENEFKPVGIPQDFKNTFLRHVSSN